MEALVKPQAISFTDSIRIYQKPQKIGQLKPINPLKQQLKLNLVKEPSMDTKSKKIS